MILLLTFSRCGNWVSEIWNGQPMPSITNRLGLRTQVFSFSWYSSRDWDFGSWILGWDVLKREWNIFYQIIRPESFPIGSAVKNLPAMQEILGFNPWVRKIPWRKKWQPTPVFLPGESHGQRSLEGYSPKVWKELGMTEKLNTHTHLARVCS